MNSDRNKKEGTRPFAGPPLYKGMKDLKCLKRYLKESCRLG